MTPETYKDALRWRNIGTPCGKCFGSGVRMYGSTATWRGGVGGCSMTQDVCDQCWGSGDDENHWLDLKAQRKEQAAWSDEQCLGYFARTTGIDITGIRKHMLAIADILNSEERRRKTPFDAESGGFWWRQTLTMVASGIRRLGR